MLEVNIQGELDRIDVLISDASSLRNKLDKFHRYILEVGSVAGIDNTVVQMRDKLKEIIDCFEQQKVLYEKLQGQIKLKETILIGQPSSGVREAEKTLESIRLKGHEIFNKKSRFRILETVFVSQIELFKEKLPQSDIVETLMKKINEDLKAGLPKDSE
ncbi:hypothetical protein KY309_01335 [Candidatus Woesearchaeota archaeon]|nr:hypothetical protein [Candidatus Woesearchaeota archaeon]